MSKKKNQALKEARAAISKPGKRKQSSRQSARQSSVTSKGVAKKQSKRGSKLVGSQVQKGVISLSKIKAAKKPERFEDKKDVSEQTPVKSKSSQRSGYGEARTKPISVQPRERGLKSWLWRHRVVLSVLVVLLILVGVGTTIYVVQKHNFENYRAEQTAILDDAKAQLSELFQDEKMEKPIRSVSEEQVRAVEEQFDEITFEDYQAEKDERKAKAASLYEFISVREELDGKFEEGVLKSATTAQEIDEAAQHLQRLPKGYQEVLRERFDEMKNQYQQILDLEEAVKGLFADEALAIVRNDIVRSNYDEVMGKYNALLQADVKEKWREKLEQVDKELGVREEEARRRAEEAWRKAEEARRVAAEAKRRQEAEIAAAWHVLNVPYHSQNLQAIYNGCETASLLMGLQYKGYLPGMNLRTYAEMIPKSTDPFQGFTYSIWDLEPKHAAHWIAPPPLAQFGRDTSGAEVTDITGASLDQLDAEIAVGNPVIIYLTFNYVSPKEWVEGAPRNLHVVLLTGYNDITGAQLITDPWTQANGATTWILSKQTVESIYNATGQRAVVIR